MTILTAFMAVALFLVLLHFAADLIRWIKAVCKSKQRPIEPIELQQTDADFLYFKLKDSELKWFAFSPDADLLIVVDNSLNKFGVCNYSNLHNSDYGVICNTYLNEHVNGFCQYDPVTEEAFFHAYKRVDDMCQMAFKPIFNNQFA